MRILLIEDNPGDARLLKETLSTAEGRFEIEHASDLTQGFQFLAAHQADVVILDLRLPESTGIETLTKFQQRAAHLPVVVMTGTDDMSLALQAVAEGAEDYLVKGRLEPALLARSLAYAVERKRMKIELIRHKDQLEEMVRERTEQLVQLNVKLADEVAVRKRAEADLRTLSHRLVEAQEEERRAVARELHDQVGQILTGLLCILESARQCDPSEISPVIVKAQDVARELVNQIRSISQSLRPAILDELGLLPALQWHCERFSNLTGVHVDFSHDEIPKGLPLDLSVTAYRIVQEALTNVARHADTQEAKVHVGTARGMIQVRVEDGGKGFDASGVGQSSGISGMRERAALLGGRLVVDASPGRGTRVIAEVPIDGSRPSRAQRPSTKQRPAAPPGL